MVLKQKYMKRMPCREDNESDGSGKDILLIIAFIGLQEQDQEVHCMNFGKKLVHWGMG